MIYIIGDSHSTLYENTDLYNIWTKYIELESGSPMTIYRLCREGIDVNKLIKPFSPQKGDIVLLSYRFNDVAKNVKIQLEKHGKNPHETIETLLDDLEEYIGTFNERYGVVAYPYMVTHPFRVTPSKNYTASPQERLEWTIEMNNMIKERWGIDWENMFSFLYDEEGYINPEYMRDPAHINDVYGYRMSKIIIETLQ